MEKRNSLIAAALNFSEFPQLNFLHFKCPFSLLTCNIKSSLEKKRGGILRDHKDKKTF